MFFVSGFYRNCKRCVHDLYTRSSYRRLFRRPSGDNIERYEISNHQIWWMLWLSLSQPTGLSWHVPGIRHQQASSALLKVQQHVSAIVSGGVPVPRSAKVSDKREYLIVTIIFMTIMSWQDELGSIREELMSFKFKNPGQMEQLKLLVRPCKPVHV